MKKLLRTAITGIRGNDFKREYLEIKSIDSEYKLLKFQENYLKKLILHAYEDVPYYHRIFKEIGVINDGTVNLSKFNEIPILTKEIIREH